MSSTAVMTPRLELDSLADTVLKTTAKFWFVVAVLGQFVFGFSVAAFYSMAALRGGFEAWNKTLFNGYVSGATMSNSALMGHILFATVISIAGALQLIPQIRNHFPVFHRWNGRLYVVAAITQGITGLYLTLFGKTIPTAPLAHVAIWISGVLLIFCAVMALRYAVARDFQTHRRWALRLFLVGSGSWFFRVGFAATALLLGPLGFDTTDLRGPLPVFWSFGQYLLPLAVLELYLYTQRHPGALRRMVTAGVLFVLTLGMGAGIFANALGKWVPNIKTAFDPRKSIGDTLLATITSSGIEQAEQQYRDLKASASANAYNFKENELNNLGYQLLHANKFKEAIRILQLNVEAYPQSSNVYDSLAEAYMDDSNKPLAIANYQKSLELNPKNHNAVDMLRKLNAP